MHWDDYWKSTQGLSSFADMKSEIGYPGEVLDFWKDIISNYNSQELAVADLATGKGALAVWLKVVSKKTGVNLQVEACDSAKIDAAKIKLTNPAYQEALEEVNFSFSTSVEELPYDDCTFDLLVSQFGFEYSNWNKSIRESIRVLKPKGKLVFMLHHKKSAITLDSLAGVLVLETLQKSEIINELKNVITLKLNNKHEEFAQKNSDVITKLNNFPLQSEVQANWYMDVMKKIANCMQSMNSESLMKINTLERSIFTQIERLTDQINVALTEQEIKNKLNSFKSLLEINKLKEFEVEKQTFAWVVELIKK